MKAVFAFIGLATCVEAAPAYADPQPPAKTRAANAPKDPYEVICHRDVEVGSLIAKKEQCRTRAEWANSEREHQRASQELLDRPVATSGGN